MQVYNEKQLTISNANSLNEFVAYTTVGDREEQQDSFGFQINNDSLLAVVCDGMGGHNGGAVASKLAVNELMNRLILNNGIKNIPEYLIDIFRKADIKVASIRDNEGNILGAGTTAIAVMIKKNELYWCSVGDSRIYLVRGNDMIQATCDHTYKLVLDSQLMNGDISQEEYNNNLAMGDALVSFLGVGNLPMTDINQESFKLCKNDIVILTSDGLYKYLSENEIKGIVTNFSDLNDVVEALDAKVRRGSRKIKLKRDNMTMIIIKTKRSVWYDTN